VKILLCSERNTKWKLLTVIVVACIRKQLNINISQLMVFICSSALHSRYMFRGFGVTLLLCLQADSTGSSGCLSDKGEKICGMCRNGLNEFCQSERHEGGREYKIFDLKPRALHSFEESEHSNITLCRNPRNTSI